MARKITKSAVRAAYTNLSSRQVNRRNDAATEGWRITYSWGYERVIAFMGIDAARVTLGTRGGIDHIDLIAGC